MDKKSSDRALERGSSGKLKRNSGEEIEFATSWSWLLSCNVTESTEFLCCLLGCGVSDTKLLCCLRQSCSADWDDAIGKYFFGVLSAIVLFSTIIVLYLTIVLFLIVLFTVIILLIDFLKLVSSKYSKLVEKSTVCLQYILCFFNKLISILIELKQMFDN